MIDVNNSTEQEVFDYVLDFLLEQGESSREDALTCKYRLEKEGRILKCAAGCLIKDENYTSEIEGKSWITVGLPAKVGIFNHERIIYRMQQAHDATSNLNFKEGILDKFKKIADQNNLNFKYEQGTN